MSECNQAPFELIDLEPTVPDAVEELRAGLSSERKKIHPKYFYDERGSHLFDQITKLPEYYLTRTEIDILNSQRDEIASFIGQQSCLVEYGSGSSEKVEVLIDAIKPRAYMPVDISAEHLIVAAKRIHDKYLGLAVYPVIADYTNSFVLPRRTNARKIAFFPGSSIGNFERTDAASFLNEIRNAIGNDGALLLGIDARKSPHLIQRAYNDSEGVTAAFNLNVLNHINTKVRSDFVPAGFRHRAVYLADEGRIEMYLESVKDQSVELAGESYRIRAGELIHTENSYKYSRVEIDELAQKGGFTCEKIWTDENEFFYVALMRA